MAHIAPLPPEPLGEHEELFVRVEQAMGFVPNSLATMARVPGLASAFIGLVGAVHAHGLVDPSTMQLVARATTMIRSLRSFRSSASSAG